MAYKLGIFIQKKEGHKLEKWLPERYSSVDEAEAACSMKNRNLGIANTNSVPPGRRFAMFYHA